MENVFGKHNPLVSIIIPCREVDEFTKRCISYCKKLQEKKEIIVVPDFVCPGYPAAKRNWAMKRAMGDIFAFIDSDAYPHKYWLEAALSFLKIYPAVCGPGVLPHDAPASEKIANQVYKWMPYSYRVIPREAGLVPEYPTFNLIVRREVATEFEDYLTGEDSLFCRKIPGGIFYHPNILVFHNRRGIFKPLWKQVATYGRHRGNFIKLALVAWVTSFFTYGINFVKGFLTRRP